MKHIFLTATFMVGVFFSTSVQAADDQKPSAPTPGAESRELFTAITRMDSAMFDAFNAHDVDKLMSMFTDDLEFYQDNDGLKNYKECSADFRTMLANNPDIRRELIKERLEVYPIKNYGAIEIGAHRFCHKENGKEECGTFQFLMVWRKTGDLWKVSRVISYGH